MNATYEQNETISETLADLDVMEPRDVAAADPAIPQVEWQRGGHAGWHWAVVYAGHRTFFPSEAAARMGWERLMHGMQSLH